MKVCQIARLGKAFRKKLECLPKMSISPLKSTIKWLDFSGIILFLAKLISFSWWILGLWILILTPVSFWVKSRRVIFSSNEINCYCMRNGMILFYNLCCSQLSNLHWTQDFVEGQDLIPGSSHVIGILIYFDPANANLSWNN